MNKFEDLVKELTPTQDTKSKTYTAEVSHTDDEGIVWVRLPGAEQDTPTASTSSEVKMGDTVTVEWRNNKLYIAGNYSNPSAGITRVSKAEQTAEKAVSDAETARAVAESAQETATEAITIAGDTDQHFWFTETGTDTGAHITEATQEDFLADPTNGGGNLLARSNGIAVRDGLSELASFAANGAQIGQTSGAHTTIGSSGMQVYKDASTQLANIGYGEGQGQTGTAEAPYYSMGVRGSGGVGNYSMAEGHSTRASGFCSHAEGDTAHADGWAAHAEGAFCTARENYSHAEGYVTYAYGEASHAEGSGAKASGYASHAQNDGTTAEYDSQTAIGKYNNNKQNNAFEIGNGYTDNAVHRSNAFEVDWDGNITASGTITAVGHSSPIGTVLYEYLTSDMGVNTSTGKAICSINLHKGTWQLIGYVRFPSDNSGVRRACFDTTSGSNAIHVQQTATQGGVTQMQVNSIVEVTAASQRWYLNVWHNSTSSLTMPAGTATGYINGIRAVRIA